MKRENLNREQTLIFAGGLNLNKDPKAVRPDQHVYSKNCFPNFSGILGKRPGLAFAQMLGVDGTIVPYSQTSPPIKTSYPYIGHVIDNSVPAVPVEYLFIGPKSDAITTKFVDNNVTLQISNKNEIDPINYTLYNDKVIMTRRAGFPGGGNFVYALLDPITKQYEFAFANFVSASNAQTQSTDVNPQCACTYKGRMFYANFGVGMEHWGVFSDFASTTWIPSVTEPIFTLIGSDVLAVNGRHLEFQAIAGEQIVACFEAQLMAVGSPVDTCLIILTTKSMLICTGDITQTSDTGSADPNEMFGDFKINRVNYDVGCASPNTIVKTPYGYAWASDSDVWMLAGNQPIKIGTNITQAIQDTPPDARKFWTAAYCKDPGVYALDMIQNRGVDDTFLSHIQYWLQLNDASMPQNADQAKWFGPMIVERDNGDGTSFHGGISLSADGLTIVKLVTDGGYATTNKFGTTLVSLTDQGADDDISFQTTPPARMWTANELVGVNDAVRPTFYVNNGLVYICDTPGTTGGTEPTWPGAGLGVADNTVHWTEASALKNFRSLNYDSSTEDLVNHAEWWSKQFDMGYPSLDKQFIRCDMSLYSSILTSIVTNIITNGGDIDSQKIAGVTVIGKTSDLRAGESQLDLSSLSSLGVEIGAPISSPIFEGRSIRPVEGQGLIRGRYLQTRFRDGGFTLFGTSGKYIIDSSNNALAFGIFDPSGAVDSCSIYQLNLPLSAFGVNLLLNSNALYAYIETQLNAMLPLPAGSGGNATLGTWSITPPSGSSPYNVNVTQSYNDHNGTVFIAFLFGDSNAYSTSGLSIFDNIATYPTVDLLKSKKLLSMMGFDCDTTPGIADLTPVGGPDTMFWIPANLHGDLVSGGGMNPDHIFGKNPIAYNRTGKLQFGDGMMQARITTTPPLQLTSR